MIRREVHVPFNADRGWYPDTSVETEMEAWIKHTTWVDPDDELWYLLRECMEELDEQQQAIVDCVAVAGHSIRRASRILNIGVGTLHKEYRDAIRIVRNNLETRLEELDNGA